MSPDTEKKLFLVDGMPLIYRAHFALMRTPRLTADGMNTSAIFGYTNTLLHILDSQSPTHMVVAFDTPVPTQRHKEFPAYKAQREAMPEDLAAAIPHVKAVTEAMHIPIISRDGFEADDIIGTLARRAREEGYITYMVTPDKDFAQLVDDQVFLYRPGRGGEAADILGVPEILEQWGIERVAQVIDILGLWGDASDNIPGVPGIGEKTAKKLIAQYGSIENLIEHRDELKGKQRENVEAFTEQALLSKRLVTIDVEVPLDIDLADCVRREPDAKRLQPLLRKFEFSTINRRLFGSDTEPAKVPEHDLFGETVPSGAAPSAEEGEPLGELMPLYKTATDVAHDYRSVESVGDRAALLARLGGLDAFCFDCETTGKDVKTAALIGIAFACEPGSGFFVSIPEDPAAAADVLAEFRPLFANTTIEKVGHNLKYDISVLKWHGIEVVGPLFDTMVAHYLTEPVGRHNLDDMARHYLDYSPIPYSALVDPADDEAKTLRDVAPEALTEYACEDADITWQLATILRPLVKELNAQRIFGEVECPLIPVLVAMEHAGIAFDAPSMREYAVQISDEIRVLEKEITNKAGTEFNLNSPKQLGEVLFDVLKLEAKPKKTGKTGQYSTNEQVLSRLATRHPIARDILDFRTLRKLESTYVHMLPESVHAPTGRIHTHYNSLVAATGRMQSSGPNLQNIPIRTARGREIRRAFIAGGPGYAILSADYSQIELRIIAGLSGDAAMMAAFTDGEDIHQATAAKVFGVAADDVTDEMRRRSKMVNFGIIYGISAFGLSQRLNISRVEAAEIIENYFLQYTGIRTWIDTTIEVARENGYVETILGRRRVLRDINSRNHTQRAAEERNAVNTPIQGSAADLIKLAMIHIHRELSDGGLKTRMLLQVHDELVFELFEEEKDAVIPIVERCMVNAIDFGVPLEIETGIGTNWLEAH